MQQALHDGRELNASQSNQQGGNHISPTDHELMYQQHHAAATAAANLDIESNLGNSVMEGLGADSYSGGMAPWQLQGGGLAASANYQHQMEQLERFWADQMTEIEKMEADDYKQHLLPLARIKKIMKADEDVKQHQMISAEAPVLFAKACELFILELTHRSWVHTEENKRRTLQRADLAQAVSKTDLFDFLIDIVPRDELARLPKKDPPLFDPMQLYMMNSQMGMGGQQQEALIGANPNGSTWPSHADFMHPGAQQHFVEQMQQGIKWSYA
eukprot:GHVL01023821.1.p1 GENE.GHVL01023821.1~~GHVL01023821.1.p1  ORF type:complete len:271 (-),score=51.89 GHVL01023821.1:477-1289(-)